MRTWKGMGAWARMQKPMRYVVALAVMVVACGFTFWATAILDSGPTYDIDPAWSPDGNDLVFVCYRPSLVEVLAARLGAPGNGDVPFPAQSSELCQYDISSARLSRLTRDRFSDLRPSWSPDDRWLAFISDKQGAPQLFIADSSGQGARLIPDSAGLIDYAWAPEGGSIAFSHNIISAGGVYTASVRMFEIASSTTRTLVALRESFFASISWSPDGTNIAVETPLESSSCGVLFLSYPRSQIAPFPGVVACSVNGPAWAPQGSQVASVSPDRRTILIFDLRTGKTVPIPLAGGSLQSADWSPEGQNLVAILDTKIVSTSVADQRATTLADLAARGLVPSGLVVSPVDGLVAFTGFTQDLKQAEVWMLHRDGGQLYNLEGGKDSE